MRGEQNKDERKRVRKAFIQLRMLMAVNYYDDSNNSVKNEGRLSIWGRTVSTIKLDELINSDRKQLT